MNGNVDISSQQVENLLVRIKQLEEENRDLRTRLAVKERELRELSVSKISTVPSRSNPKRYYPIVCSKCDRHSSIPFPPQSGGSYLCRLCYREYTRNE